MRVKTAKTNANHVMPGCPIAYDDDLDSMTPNQSKTQLLVQLDRLKSTKSLEALRCAVADLQERICAQDNELSPSATDDARSACDSRRWTASCPRGACNRRGPSG